MFFEIPELLALDCSCAMGKSWDIQLEDMNQISSEIERANRVVGDIRKSGKGPDGTDVFFPRLPKLLDEHTLMSEEEFRNLKELQARVKNKVDVLISVGIGGSYLGNQMLFDLFCGRFWNMSEAKRNGFPQVFFAGNNVDPDSLNELSQYIREEAREKGRPYHVMLLVISKSGTTIEPTTAMYALRKALSDCCELEVVTITDKEHGKLLHWSEDHHCLHFTAPEGIGGRFSVLSQVGMVFGAICGIDIREILKGALAMEQACQSEDWKKNPALALAAVKYIATTKYGITSEIVMPYGDALRSLGWWYAQLMAESLGKKKDLDGNTIYYGRTLAPCVGTTDMHSMTQEHQEGKKNKIIQFITVENPDHDLTVECEEQGETGMTELGKILNTAMKSNAEALANEGRMSCRVTIPDKKPYHIGALIYFFMLATAYEGAMANINTFDQPGVEAYKKILHAYIKSYISETK